MTQPPATSLPPPAPAGVSDATKGERSTRHQAGDDVERRGKPAEPARQVLMLLFHFPPLGGVAVPRNVRNVAYLPRFGWTRSSWPRAAPPAPGSRRGVPHPAGDRVIRASARSRATCAAWSIHSASDRPGGAPSASRRRALHSPGEPGAGPAPEPPDDTAEDSGGPAPTWAWRLYRMLAFPDGQVGWLPFAAVAAVRAHRARSFDVIYSTPLRSRPTSWRGS